MNTNVKRKNLLVLVLISLLVILMTISPTQAFADRGQTGSAYTNLITTLIQGSYTSSKTSTVYDFSQNNYKMSDGGYAIWYTLWNQNATSTANTGSGSNTLLTSTYENLTAGAKQDFLEDAFTLANAMADDTAYKAKNGMVTGDEEVTEETVNDFLTAMQNASGMGSTLLASILQNTKPDYVTANRIYEPFSGPVGTILGLLAILIMALLGVSMALDIFYIVVPAVQLALGDGDGGNGSDQNNSGIGKIISIEARKAVKEQSDGAGSNGQNGSSNKMAIGIYFKARWKGLLLLGICLLYLVQGQIYSFVAWIINLLSGFIGF